MYVCMYVCIGFKVYRGFRVGIPHIALAIHLAMAAVKDLGSRVQHEPLVHVRYCRHFGLRSTPLSLATHGI